MKDLIDREAAIRHLYYEYHGMISDESMKIYKIVEWLCCFPSIEPERSMRQKVKVAKEAIEQTMKELKENGKYHDDPVRHNGEMVAYGLKLALRILKESIGEEDEQSSGNLEKRESVHPSAEKL